MKRIYDWPNPPENILFRAYDRISDTPKFEYTDICPKCGEAFKPLNKDMYYGWICVECAKVIIYSEREILFREYKL